MKKLIASLFAFATVLSASSAFAAQTCSLSFRAHGGGAQVIVGHFKLHGDGFIHCINLSGKVTDIPVNVQIGGKHPVALRAGIGHMTVHGISKSFALGDNVGTVLGEYMMAGAEASLGVGIGAGFSLHNPETGVAMDLALEGVTGIGAELGFSTLSIKAVD